jgi:RHS repeat-associated protein
MSGSGGNCTGLSWSYDAWGNRTAQTPTGGTCNQSNLTFDANNRITTSGFTYDADGNVTYDGVHHYYYDAENRLIQTDGTPGTCSTAAACYFYDTQGRRVQKIIGSGETSYLFDLSGHVVAEDYGTGWGPGYVYAGGQLIAEYKNSTTFFVHDNNIGTSTILTNMAGGINPGDCNALYPFGEQDNTTCSTSNLTTHKFTGKERDTESNLDNFGARYYSSAQGRFLTADWSAIPAPVPYADLHNPQTLNLYAYVGNNPLGKVDPDGHGEQDAQTTTKPEGNGEAPDPAGAAAATGMDKKQVAKGGTEIVAGVCVIVGILQPEVAVAELIGGSLLSSGLLVKGATDIGQGATGGHDTSEMKEAIDVAQNPVKLGIAAVNGGNMKQANQIGDLAGGVSSARSLLKDPHGIAKVGMAVKDVADGIKATVGLVSAGRQGYANVTKPPVLPVSLRPPGPPQF